MKRARRVVIVPVKALVQAKSRLSAALDAPARRRVAQRLFICLMQQLATLRDAQRADGREAACFDIAVITHDDTLAGLARTFGAAAIDEGLPPFTLNRAVTRAARHAADAGYEAACFLPADLAGPHTDDLARLIGHPLAQNRAVLVPSRDLGTNALLLAPPDAIRFCYGPRSFARHFAIAEAAGLQPLMLPLRSLRQDIDTTGDLDALPHSLARLHRPPPLHTQSPLPAPLPAGQHGRHHGQGQNAGDIMRGDGHNGAPERRR